MADLDRQETCKWSHEESNSWYDTECDHTFVSEDADVEDWAKYCCYCGGSLSVHIYPEDDESIEDMK